MSFRLGTLLLFTSGCATVSLDENAARIERVMASNDPIPPPLAVGEAEPLSTAPWNTGAGRPGVAPGQPAPEGYRWVPSRRGPKLMREPGYIGVEIGEVRTGDVSINTGPTTRIGPVGITSVR
ncbi:MAG TPA: hypothetical protein VLV15_09470 [Dongiaceae bacterium]|nr:hypothetical protein [Dongiaceae bacterium]